MRACVRVSVRARPRARPLLSHLQHVEHAAHVAVGQTEHRLEAVFRHVDAAARACERGPGWQARARCTHPSSLITSLVRSTIWSSRRGAKRKVMQRDCRAGMILFTKLQMRQKRVFLV